MNDQVEFKKVLSPTAYDRKLPKKQLPRADLDTWIGYWPDIPYLRVCWHGTARLATLAHCYENPDIEVGGVLLGNIYRTAESNDVPIDFIEITGSIKANSHDAGIGHVRFTPETWARINRIRDQKFSQLAILGWYHTHPGHEVFLSNHDLFIHNNFFSGEFQLALVIETHKHYGAFFVDSENMGGPYRSEEFRWDHEFLGMFLKKLNQRSVGDEATQVNVPSRAVKSDRQVIGGIEISEEELSADVTDSSRSIESTQESYSQSRYLSRSSVPDLLRNIFFLSGALFAIIATLFAWISWEFVSYAVAQLQGLENLPKQGVIVLSGLIIIVAIVGVLLLLDYLFDIFKKVIGGKK